MASKILVGGKFDGRTPKVLIKMAYKNLRAGKANLLDGIIDPWDEALHDVTDTATFTQTNKEPKSPTKTGKIQKHIQAKLFNMTVIMRYTASNVCLNLSSISYFGLNFPPFFVDVNVFLFEVPASIS